MQPIHFQVTYFYKLLAEFTGISDPSHEIFGERCNWHLSLEFKPEDQKSRHIKTHQDTSRHIKTHQDTSRHIYWDLFEILDGRKFACSKSLSHVAMAELVVAWSFSWHETWGRGQQCFAAGRTESNQRLRKRLPRLQCYLSEQFKAWVEGLVDGVNWQFISVWEVFEKCLQEPLHDWRAWLICPSPAFEMTSMGVKIASKRWNTQASNIESQYVAKSDGPILIQNKRHTVDAVWTW